MRTLLLGIGLAATLLAPQVSFAEIPPVFLTMWGSPGSAPGQFDRPHQIAMDSEGNVYVAEMDGYRIQKFTGDGAFITMWGSPGSGPGQFGGLGRPGPWDVAVGPSGAVYVVDANNYRIQKFTSDGVFLLQWSRQGIDGQSWVPSAVAVGPSGNVYVGVSINYPPSMEVLQGIETYSDSGVLLDFWGSTGTGDGQFAGILDVAADPSGHIYVSDQVSDRVQKFDADGTFLLSWGGTGSLDGQLDQPYGIAVDGLGHVYVADANNARIQAFSTAGVYLTKWGSLGSGQGEFWGPTGVAAGGDGAVFVADSGNDRVQKFGEAPVPVEPSTWGRIKAAYLPRR